MAKKPAAKAGSGAPARAGTRARSDTGPAPAAPAIPTPGLDAIIGQHRAVAILRAAVASRRVHHAWIFAGPAGVGKFSAAGAFARMLLDPANADGSDPSPSSPVQALISAGTHPDLHVITKALARFSDERSVRESKLTTIPKDVIEKHLLGPVGLSATMPGGAARKVFIVDEAELLDRSPSHAPVQNALLKTLEEPPPGTVIILVTSEEGRLLPTIRSRCQRVAFSLLDDEAMRRWLERAGAGAGLSPAELEWAIEFARGSPGQFVLASTSGLLAWRETLDPLLDEGARGRWPIELGPTLAKLVDEWAARWVETRPNASKEAANREAVGHALAYVAEHARRRLREPDPARWLEAIDAADEAQRFSDANVPVAMVMDNLAARLAEAR